MEKEFKVLRPERTGEVQQNGIGGLSGWIPWKYCPGR